MGHACQTVGHRPVGQFDLRFLFRDYWNITSINLTLKANVNSTSKSLEVDLTPRFSYNTPTEYR